MIQVYNTLSKTKEPFETVAQGKVGIYLCGPTVYKPSHIGHMVGPVIFDAVKRYLTYCGFDVTLVINITDVDDKLIGEARSRGTNMETVAAEMIDDYMANITALGVDSVDHFPKATDHIDNIIRFTSDLIEKDFAYASGGDVYFDVAKFPEYGKLSHRLLDEMQGEGGGTASRKRSPSDFALWKSAKPGEPSWESPWGPGRPGWHIECSVMSSEILGETFDIHGGGLDLVFPHHENEVAQSECRHGKPMVRYWMHNGLVQASSEVGKVGGRATRTKEAETLDAAAQEAGKISKSKGSSAFRDMLTVFNGETIRFFLLSTHYRRPIDYSEERIREVETGLKSFYQCFKSYERITGESFYDIDVAKNRADGDRAPEKDALVQAIHNRRAKFLEAMDDDFNTSAAIAELFEIVRALNKFIGDEKLEAKADADKVAVLQQGAKTLRELAGTLGLFRVPVEAAAPPENNGLTGKLLDLLVELRTDARKRKDFALSDQIRDRLTGLGVLLEDRPGGTEWSIQ